MRRELLLRGLHQTASFQRIREEPRARGFQSKWISYLDEGSGGKQLRRQFRKIFHVWTHDDRDASGEGFRRVLTAFRAQGFTDKDQRGNSVPIAEFAGGVEEEQIRRRGLLPIRGSAQADVQAEVSEGSSELSGAFHMTRRDDQEKIREPGA